MIRFIHYIKYLITDRYLIHLIYSDSTFIHDFDLKTNLKCYNLLVTYETGGILLDLCFEVRGTDGFIAHWCPQSLSELGKLWNHTHEDRWEKESGERSDVCSVSDSDPQYTENPAGSYPPWELCWPCSCYWGRCGVCSANSSPAGHGCCLDTAGWSSWNTMERERARQLL